MLIKDDVNDIVFYENAPWHMLNAHHRSSIDIEALKLSVNLLCETIDSIISIPIAS